MIFVVMAKQRTVKLVGNVSLIDGHIDEKPTNYDHIRNMSVDELARFINESGHDFPPFCDTKKVDNCECDYNCFKCAKEWLESEVAE